MAQALELAGHLHAEPGLHGDGIVPHPLPAGGVQGLLGVQVEVHVVHDHLDVALGLHVAAHDAEGTHGLAVLHQEAGNDGVVAALAGLEGVGVLLIQGEVVATVLEGDAGTAHHHAGAEAHVVGLNEGDHVALPVGTAEVDGAAFWGNGVGVDLGGGPDLSGPLGAVGGV